tara:strand:+ start:399 stop:1193 length:795 start_codon:yes stop_codon:yes gene_type:complete
MDFIYDAFEGELRLIVEAGADAPAFSFSKIAKPISWMSREELLQKRKKLQNDYFRIGASTTATSAAAGAALGGISPKLIAKKVSSPALKRVLNRASIPTAVVGGLIAGAALPSMKRDGVIKDLLAVDNKLRSTSSSHIRKLHKRASAENGHWRTLPAHWEGEGKNGEKIKGRTWVDTKPRPKAESKQIPPPQYLGDEDGQSVFVVPAEGGGATLFIMDSRIAKDFAATVEAGGKSWAASDPVVDFMAEAEERGLLAIYLAEGKQ